MRQLDSVSLLRSILALLTALLAALTTLLAALTTLLVLPPRLIWPARLTLLLPRRVLLLSGLVLIALVLFSAITHLVYSSDATSGTLERCPAP